ncbi:MAG: OsmC family protein [Gammaproteobacteria bacterium]
MTTTNTAEQTIQLINGVDVSQLMNVIGEIEADQNYGKFQFRASNQWINGSLTRSQIKEFHAGNTEDSTRKEAFTIDADEPLIAAGHDTAPNAMEYVLHALASCLTGSMVYHASVRGIGIDSVESSYKGDMDVRGLFGLSEDVRKGFNKVSVEMRVKSQASVDELTECAMFSPVFEMISKALPVEFKLTVY